MRIIAGTLRGRRLSCPAGLALRPTSDRLKETLFNILAPRMAGCAFLDLFAGSGAIGLEAHSRGASPVVLAEMEARSLQCLHDNLTRCGVREALRVLPMSSDKALARLSGEGIRFDLIFLDPPYGQTALYQQTLEAIDEKGLLAPDGLVIAEHPARCPLEELYGGLQQTRRHRVGDSGLSFYSRSVPPMTAEKEEEMEKRNELSDRLLPSESE